MNFEWKKGQIRTVADVMDALVKLKSREEAQDFMRAYQKVNVHAYQNVGYLAGYFTHEEAKRIWDWCETSHPIFGRRWPGAEEAFELGRRWAQESGA